MRVLLPLWLIDGLERMITSGSDGPELEVRILHNGLPWRVYQLTPAGVHRVSDDDDDDEEFKRPSAAVSIF